MKLTYSFCLVLLMSTMPLHASLAADNAGDEQAQIATGSADQSPASVLNLNNDTEDFGGPGRPGGPGPGGPGPGGPRPGGPGFGPGPGGPGFGPGPRPVGPGPGFGPGPRPIGPGPGFGPGPRPIGPGPGFGPGPRPIGPGFGPAPIWNFPRPVYNWNWNQVTLVTCVAQDEYGNQYPFTENSYVGIAYEQNLASIEDGALNTCYQESGDASCTLLDCTPGY